MRDTESSIEREQFAKANCGMLILNNTFEYYEYECTCDLKFI
jgi:hypothetical protein